MKASITSIRAWSALLFVSVFLAGAYAGTAQAQSSFSTPYVEVLAPSYGQVVSGAMVELKLSTNLSDAQVRFLIGPNQFERPAVQVYGTSEPTYRAYWDTTTQQWPNGQYEIIAVATGKLYSDPAGGNQAISNTVKEPFSVTVKNETYTPPTAVLKLPAPPVQPGTVAVTCLTDRKDVEVAMAATDLATGKEVGSGKGNLDTAQSDPQTIVFFWNWNASALTQGGDFQIVCSVDDSKSPPVLVYGMLTLEPFDKTAPKVVLTKPVNGNFSAGFDMVAESNEFIEQGSFRIVARDSSGKTLFEEEKAAQTVKLGTSSEPKWQWSHQWSAPVNLEYLAEVEVIALSHELELESERSALMVFTGNQKTEPANPTYKWVKPYLDNSSTLTGLEEVIVEAKPEVDSLTFTVTDLATGKDFVQPWIGERMLLAPDRFRHDWPQDIADGKFRVSAQAFRKGLAIGSPSAIEFVLEKPSSTVKLEISVASPSVNSKLASPTLIDANFSREPDDKGTSMVFELLTAKKDDGSGGLKVKKWEGQSGTTGIRWTQSADLTDVPDGDYELVAKGILPNGTVVAEKRITGLAYGKAAEPGDTLNLRLLSPNAGDKVRGDVKLQVGTVPKAEKVYMKSTLQDGSSQGNDIVLTQTGQQKNPAGEAEYLWEATWKTGGTAYPNGTYELLAVGALGTAEDKDAVSVTVANEDSSEQPVLKIVSPTDTSREYGGTVRLSASPVGFTPHRVVFVLDQIANPTTELPSEETVLNSKLNLWQYDWQAGDPKFDGQWQITAVALDSSGNKLASSRALTLTVANLAKLEVTVTKPSGSVSGTTGLSALTSKGADGVTFHLQSDTEATSAVDAFTARGESDGITWSYFLDTKSKPNGPYSLWATVKSGDKKTESQRKTITIDNEAPDPDVPSVTVVLASPQSGQEVSGQMLLSAATKQVVDKLTFTVTRAADNSPISSFEGFDSLSSGRSWTRRVPTAGIKDGKYEVVAAAFIGEDKVGASGKHGFIVNNSTTTESTQPLPDDGTKPPGDITQPLPDDGTKPPGDITQPLPDDGTKLPGDITQPLPDDGTKPPGDGFDLPPDSSSPPQPPDGEDPGQEPPEQDVLAPAVRLLIAQSVVSRIFLLKAEASSSADAVLFKVSYQDGQEQGLVIPGGLTPDGTWKALWRTTDGPNGRYTVFAKAIDREGGKGGFDGPIALEVRNVRVTPVPTSPVAPGEQTDSTPEGEPSPPPAPAQKVQLDQVEIVDEAVIRQAIRTAPINAQLVKRIQPSPQLDPAQDPALLSCTKEGISAERCYDWLAWKHRSTNQCRAAGILTKEECLGYLAHKWGSYSEEEAAIQTAGLLDSAEYSQLNEAVTARIGKTVRITGEYRRKQKPADSNDSLAPEGSQPPMEGEAMDRDQPADDLLGKYMPITGRRHDSFSLHASTAYIDNDTGTLQQQLPALLLIDTDGDGLPDDTERRFGTDPEKADTDGDGFDDLTELRNGYDPRRIGKRLDEVDDGAVSPVDAAIVAGLPLEQPKSSGTEVSGLVVGSAEPVIGDEDMAAEDADWLLSGQGTPGETVTVYVYSYLPLVLTTTVEDDGTWSYKLDDGLTDGVHTAYVTVTDDTGKINSKSAPLSFLVNEALAASEDEYFSPTVIQGMAEAPERKMYIWYLVAAAVLVLAGVTVGGLIMRRSMNKNRPSF